MYQNYFLLKSRKAFITSQPIINTKVPSLRIRLLVDPTIFLISLDTHKICYADNIHAFIHICIIKATRNCFICIKFVMLFLFLLVLMLLQPFYIASSRILFVLLTSSNCGFENTYILHWTLICWIKYFIFIFFLSLLVSEKNIYFNLYPTTPFNFISVLDPRVRKLTTRLTSSPIQLPFPWITPQKILINWIKFYIFIFSCRCFLQKKHFF